MTELRAHAPEPVYRWVIVAASAIMLAVSMGMMVNGFSVFFFPLKEEFGWQRGAVSLVNFSGLIGLAVGGIVMGRIADRTYTRLVALMGAVILGLCLLAASQANALWQFYALFFLAGLLGAGSLFAPLVANAGNWFVTGAGLAIGIVAAGQALGQGGVPYLTAILIEQMGWRGALATMGLITLGVLVPMALLIKQSPYRASTSAQGGSAANDESPVPLSPNVVVAWMSLAVIFCCTCMSVPLMHLVPLVQDRGIALDDAGSVLFLMLLVGILGRIAFGKLADLIGAIQAYWVASLWQTVLVFAFIQMKSLSAFYLMAVVYGFGYAGVMTGLLVCVRALTPLSRRASALGIVVFFGWLGHAIGGYQGGFFFDLIGDYTVSYANAALTGVINLIIVGSLYVTINRRQAAVAAGA